LLSSLPLILLSFLLATLLMKLKIKRMKQSRIGIIWKGQIKRVMKEWFANSRGHLFSGMFRLFTSSLVASQAVIPQSPIDMPQADQEIPYLHQQQEQQQILLPVEEQPHQQMPPLELQHERQPLPQVQKLISPQTHDRRVLELQQHLLHQQASHEQIIILKEKLHETEMSQLKRKLEELRDQPENRNRLSYQPNQQQHYRRYQPFQRPINLQRYQTLQQINCFNTDQDQKRRPSYQPGMKSNCLM
jgi:hypothetical protein